METQTQQELLEQQRQIWNKYSGGWKSWDDLLMSNFNPIGLEIIDHLELQKNAKVLDVATGTGHPGIVLSKRLTNGSVTGLDLSEKMVIIANEQARLKGIENYHAVAGDAANMPFNDEEFDAVISRFGIMFFPDIVAGLREMRRVVKNGGTISVAVWGSPEKNPFIALMANIVRMKLNLEPPPPDMPGVFRCAEQGYTASAVKEAGLHNVQEREATGEVDFDTADTYWRMMCDCAGPVVEALKTADQSIQDEVKKEVLATANARFSKNGKIVFPWSVLVATGVR